LPLIKPSPGAVKRIRKRLRTEMLALRGGNAASVLKKGSTAMDVDQWCVVWAGAGGVGRTGVI
jgi:NADPH:quinone reductase-like Zn-dependent oxidoreductase